MGRHKKELLLYSDSLEVGESVRIQCPTCQGKDDTLSVTRKEDGIVWNCYRASCDERGGSGGVRTHGDRKPRQKPNKLHPYTGSLEPLNEEQAGVLMEHTGLPPDRIYWAVEEERFAFPILSPMGVRRGWVLRAWPAPTWGPKALTRMDVEEPHLSWFRNGPGTEPTWLVEDIPSAMRASKYVNTVALCGTGCGPDYALEIAYHAPTVVWALDADATGHAITLHNRWMALFSWSRVRPLPKDLKDMSEDELKKILGG